jgi:hypothetical protein
MQRPPVMLNGTDRGGECEFRDVEVLANMGSVLRCRIGDAVVGVPLLGILFGTTIHRGGDCGVLVIPAEVAYSLGLTPKER